MDPAASVQNARRRGPRCSASASKSCWRRRACPEEWHSSSSLRKLCESRACATAAARKGASLTRCSGPLSACFCGEPELAWVESAGGEEVDEGESKVEAESRSFETSSWSVHCATTSASHTRGSSSSACAPDAPASCCCCCSSCTSRT
eukprot:1809139-Rhodomonas_salina.2